MIILIAIGFALPPNLPHNLCNASAQAPNRYGWVYEPFPSGFGWVVPRASPSASVAQTIGVTELMIRYSRPAVNGRVIWGELVPFGEVWRTGANEATVFSVSTDVRIDGRSLPAGEYGLFVIVENREQATFIFNRIANQWGAFAYNLDEDALRIPVESQSYEGAERLQFTIPSVTDTTARVALQWANRLFTFDVGVDTRSQAREVANETFDWQAGFFAAAYFFEKGDQSEEALRWVNEALALEETASSLFLKSRILAGLHRIDEAIVAAERVAVIGDSTLKGKALEQVEILRKFKN